MKRFLLASLALFTLLSQPSRADTFGSGANSFEIDFVLIGDCGNPPDANPNPAGAVTYGYRMGTYEISEHMIDKANALGDAGITKDTRSPDKPATSASCFDASNAVTGSGLRLASVIPEPELIVTLEMTTAASIAANCSILPSLSSFSFDDLSAGLPAHISLPDVLQTSFSGNVSANGHVDLSFNLIIGSETLTQTATYRFGSYSQTAPPGAVGATASLFLEGPVIFISEIGTFTINRSFVISNLLGRPQGSVAKNHLNVRMAFVPVPEPQNSMLLLFSLVIPCCRRCRIAKSASPRRLAKSTTGRIFVAMTAAGDKSSIHSLERQSL